MLDEPTKSSEGQLAQGYRMYAAQMPEKAYKRFKCDLIFFRK